jgi:hypothetical protein
LDFWLPDKKICFEFQVERERRRERREERREKREERKRRKRGSCKRRGEKRKRK